MNWRSIKALLRKDLKEIRANSMVVLPMVIVPLVLCVVIPAVITGLSVGADVSAINGAELLERVAELYPIPSDITNPAERIVYLFLNFTFVPFFLLVPIMVTTVISANSIVGEKERHTLETLLYTPITNREFLMAKQLVAFIPACTIAITSFVVFFGVVNALSLSLAGYLMVRSIIWIPTMLLLVPATSALGLSISLLVSLRSKSFMEAQQAAGVLVLPFMLLVGVQISGIFIFNPLFVIALAVVFAFLSWLIIQRFGPRFHRERVITTL